MSGWEAEAPGSMLRLAKHEMAGAREGPTEVEGVEVKVKVKDKETLGK